MRGGLQSAEEGGREGRGGVRKGRCRRRDGGEGGERKPVGWAGGWVWGGRAHKPQPARRWVTAVEGLGLGGEGVPTWLSAWTAGQACGGPPACWTAAATTSRSARSGVVAMQRQAPRMATARIGVRSPAKMRKPARSQVYAVAGPSSLQVFWILCVCG